jgi:hypothetical protein
MGSENIPVAVLIRIYEQYFQLNLAWRKKVADKFTHAV